MTASERALVDAQWAATFWRKRWHRAETRRREATTAETMLRSELEQAREQRDALDRATHRLAERVTAEMLAHAETRRMLADARDQRDALAVCTGCSNPYCDDCGGR